MPTSCDDLAIVLNRVISSAGFGPDATDTPPHGSLLGQSINRYRNHADDVLEQPCSNQMQRQGWSSGNFPMTYCSTTLRLDDGLRTEVENTLRDVLRDFVDPTSDRVVHAFPLGSDGIANYHCFQENGLCSHVRYSSIRRFAEALVQGAAVVGGERIAHVVAGWVKGNPVKYRTCLVVPLTISRAVQPCEGVNIVPLAWSTNKLPSNLPLFQVQSSVDFLGRSLVYVDSETKPALFPPVEWSLDRQEVRSELTPKVSLDTIRDALSLEADFHVDHGLVWDDYGEFSALVNQGMSVRGSLIRLPFRGPQFTNADTGVSKILADNEDILELSAERICGYFRSLERASPRTRLAVSRWRMAKDRTRGLPDRLIDLRIAFESLFLPDKPTQELKFRLAVSGAWFVGENASDRHRVWKTLCEAYKLSSVAVHGGNVLKGTGTTVIDPDRVLTDGLAVCRKGIMRVLDDGPITDGPNLFLDLGVR